MKKFFLFVLASTFLVITGCADKPRSIGDGVPPSYEAFTFAETTFTAISDTSYTVPLMNGFATSNLVGILPGGEEFITLLQFIPTNIKDSLRGAKIDTAEIRLTVNYRMLPSAPPIRFGIYEVLQPFTEAGFTSDSLSASTIGTIPVESEAFEDSMNYSQEVTARIDTNVARRWADAYLDTAKPDFYGFAIKALSNSGVIGFTPFNINSSIVPTLVIKFTKEGRFDSLYFPYGIDTYAGKSPNSSPLSDLQVRGGIGVRSKIKFDVGSLIRASQDSIPIVANATFTLTADTLASLYSGYAPDTLLALMALSDSPIDSSSSSFIAAGWKKYDPAGNRVYQFTIYTIVQRWINNLSPNEGLTIRWLAETSTSEKIVFYSMSDPDESRRPKLKIIYAEKPQ